MPIIDGIHKYVGTDPATPFDALLNLLGDSVRDRFANLVASLGTTDAAWVHPTLDTGISDYNAAPWSGLWTRRRNGVLVVSGAVVKDGGAGTFTAGTVIATLPIGSRPAVRIYGNKCQISTGGAITYDGPNISGAIAIGAVAIL